MRSLNPTLGAALRLPFAALALLLCTAVQAQSTPLLNEVHTIATPDTGVPVEHSFDISGAGTYTVRLTDLGATRPSGAAPLASVKMAVTNGSTIVGTPITAAGTLQFTAAAAGTYIVHVVGKPGPVFGSGSIGIEVLDSGGATVFKSSDDLALPNQATLHTQATLDDGFTVPATGSYQVSLIDQQFPQALTPLTLAVLTDTGQLVTTLPDSTSAMQAVVSLQTGVNYRIFAVGVAAAPSNSGLYSALVTPAGGGAAIYGKTIPVGGTVLLDSMTLNPGNFSLKLVDLGFPNTLDQVGAITVQGGQAVAQLNAVGTSAPFTVATAATYETYSTGTAAAASAGGYAAALLDGSSQAVFSGARALAAADSGLSAYAYSTALTSAGDYVADLADFQFPNTITTLKLAVVQGTQILGTPLTAAGNIHFTGAVGSLTLFAFASSGATTGLFGADVVAAGTTTPTYEITQGVGSTFTARKVSVTSAGNYVVTATDVGFPAAFTNFAVVVTQGTGRIGQIVGGNGNFPFTASAGNYFLNFIAQPAATDDAGTYSLTFAPVDPTPVVDFSANSTQVESGASVTLKWTSQYASSCTASGGWSGSKNPNDSAPSGPITADTTFTLSCSGTGGTTTKSVTVTVQQKTGGGGGGSLDDFVLLLMGGIVAVRAMRRGYAPSPSRVSL